MIAKVLICTHKPCELRSDDIYTPIHVGKALSNLDLGIIGDDKGDNISKKNPNYCELTAEYWAWKNLKCDYIGLEHYRRHFDYNFTAESIEKLMKGVDVYFVTPIYSLFDIRQKLERYLTMEDVAIFYKVLMKKGVDKKVVDQYLMRNRDIRCNMFFMRKELFDEFASWQFDILSECEKYIRLSPYSRLQRIYGYLGEVLLPMWCYGRGLRVKYLPVDPPTTEWREWSRKKRIRHKIMQFVYRYFIAPVRIITKNSFKADYSALTGLKNDGIEIE